MDCSGNVLLNRFVGAKIILVPPLNYEGSVVDGVRTKGLKHKMLDYMEKLRYIIMYNKILSYSVLKSTVLLSQIRGLCSLPHSSWRIQHCWSVGLH